ncbi:enoyl-CoA hydratase-related protein [Glaciecola sp. KUL10]|uniref:enoyl-CoA hydratase-related protein n=1 Tax=Glaciecola sp. (strain KUL10) TaxID=2161813 RepID=UPI000D78A8AB|nr:enoyl-CoA hydratase-related protein [Glaciecola sp. KUL10]GBL02825.1 enoyl-CoA hydratase [Glaciecola sp. KUL10]
MIKTHLDQQILSIVIDRPEKKNALVQSMYKDIAIAIETAQEKGAKVILMTGANNCFTSGNDVADFIRNDSQGEINDTYRFMVALLNCQLPVVAKVEGLAIGIGTTMLLHCDFVLANIDTKFAMPFINLGLVPEYASSYIIPRTAGYLKANELLLLGETFDVNMAKECGIINNSFDAESLDAEVTTLIAKLKAKPLEALVASKTLIRNQLHGVQKHIDDELKVFARAMQSDAAIEAFEAFMQKRPINTDIYK